MWRLWLFFVIFTIFSSQALGGWLLSGGLGWSLFSLRPIEFEKTPNYYGVGPRLALGYSFEQKFDIAGYISYTPGHTARATFGQEQASFVFLGGQLGLRIADQVFIAILGGQATYHLLKFTDYSVPGRWEGQASGGSIGSLVEIDKERFWQVSLEYLLALLSASHGRERENRKVDQISFSITYTFNGFISKSRKRSVFKGLFN